MPSENPPIILKQTNTLGQVISIYSPIISLLQAISYFLKQLYNSGVFRIKISAFIKGNISLIKKINLYSYISLLRLLSLLKDYIDPIK